MDKQQIPDVSDPDIREMVLRDHEPEERWLHGSSGSYPMVYCAACWKDWPCPSIKAARAADQ